MIRVLIRITNRMIHVLSTRERERRQLSNTCTARPACGLNFKFFLKIETSTVSRDRGGGRRMKILIVLSRWTYNFKPSREKLPLGVCLTHDSNQLRPCRRAISFLSASQTCQARKA